mgnify:CR=1 FL=1
MAAASLCSSSRTTLRRSRLQALIDSNRQYYDVSGYHAHARYVRVCTLSVYVFRAIRGSAVLAKSCGL